MQEFPEEEAAQETPIVGCGKLDQILKSISAMALSVALSWYNGKPRRRDACARKAVRA